jgi:hypothetical protein
MQNSDSLFEQTVRLECLKMLSGQVSLDIRLDPANTSLPVDNQVYSNVRTLLEHSDALFRYVMVGDTITEYVHSGSGGIATPIKRN